MAYLFKTKRAYKQNESSILLSLIQCKNKNTMSLKNAFAREQFRAKTALKLFRYSAIVNDVFGQYTGSGGSAT